ncbi:UNVERIFIED_CONTAM: Retrovirus-related Pol polyprotein from transposon RE1 [Sesamum latifolium]|uniref:Retrovirus-related Pol polyprotein from transposon RE1 n=1 Tax=Sesamum latifolium TaxID=2727402 RepID=A0AAW2UZJ8_9LAMI
MEARATPSPIASERPHRPRFWAIDVAQTRGGGKGRRGGVGVGVGVEGEVDGVGWELGESNYDVWSQLMEMQIAGREKLEYIIGKTTPPKETDTSYAKWYSENQKVKGWLLTSMSPEIMKRYIRLRSARDIWNALAKAFYDGSDESQLFALNQRAFSTKQVGRPLSIYYGDLVEIFQEMDHRDKIVMKDPDDIITYKKSVEKLRVHIFLNGLDAEFEQIQGEILRKDPPLDLEETYAYVRRDFVRRTTMNGDSNQSESTALIARRTKPQHTNSKLGFSTSGDATARSARICTNCGEVGHTKARCYELIGYPEWWDPSKAPRKRNSKPNHHATVAVTKPTNVSENSSNHASVAVVESSNTGKVFHTYVPTNNSAWIIDSGATDHMTFDTNHVKSLKPSSQQIVSTANGNPSPVAGEGSVSLTEHLNLDSVLVVPTLKHNLLMITTQYQAHIQVLRTDNGGEFVNQDLQRYLNLHGIVHQMTCPYSPQQNGVAERKNRHLLEVVRASLFEANMPTSYWGEAVTVATYLINRMPSSSLQFRTPFDVLYKIDAVRDPKWKEAMNEEMKSLHKNSTWEIVDLPEGKKPVGCRWVFTIKYKADGTIERYKARLVAKGYTQTYGIDYMETFAPVAKINTVCILLSLAVNLNWYLHQFDVKNAFLHGDLQEKVYMDLPPGCNMHLKYSKQVCRLKKALYGLKQSPRAWFGRFTKSMKSFGYKQSNSDHTLFLKHNKEKVTALIVYVDDMIVTGNDPEERKALQKHLAREFEMKDLGQLKYFL